ncbi:MAG: hypothetical protein A3D47_01930 [Candidatus Colwellbacteria bacterium RIFCSPHIGHO2_02_FULL_43_15]|uniref:Uncharacterized protein n=2 Tax=Candidatus Colwelliibacteriota TaxID=1817904 RepID=A0A1G1Z276_9BACT|nr:MAG: hypothetical protein A3D47_01930 [Candidatus Colwellbacteria bacterium RIFCSPHIGHO2_02_FULL_43_15]OGY60615.1 MAG: hypothetical protein A3F99_01245 [Candidatus Colwellbacteria bacterium RIFCSPLOWO2_12_FULL_43_11]
MDESTTQKIAKNTFWLFGGQITGRILRAAIIIYAARVLGAASWGAFSYALSLAAFLTIFSDFGINALLTREGVKNPELRRHYLSTSLIIKLVMILVLVIFVFIFGDRLTNLEEAAALIPIVVFIFAFDSLRDLGTSMARATERMHLEAIVNVVTNLFIAVFGFIFLSYYGTASSLAWAYAIGTGAGLVIIFYIFREYLVGLTKNFDKQLAKKILTSAWPFGLLGLMGVIMINTDVLMLGWLTSAEQTGLYSAAQKPIQLLYLAPSLLAAAFFPTLTRFAKETGDGFRNVFEKGLAATYIVAIPLTIGGVILSAPIVKLLYGVAYMDSATSFAILAASMLVVFPATLIANGIFAHEKQKNLIGYVVLGVLGNIFFNLLFIPVWGIEGSALSTLINQIIINVYLWQQFNKVSPFSMLTHLKKMAVAGIIMGFVIFMLNSFATPVLINILLGGLVYILSLRLLKEPTLSIFKKILKGPTKAAIE